MRYTGEDADKQTYRDKKGWEWGIDKKTGTPRMSEASAGLMREQADEIRRETRDKLSKTQTLDASRRMGNPAQYAKGGKVRKIDGCATKGKTKGTMR